MVCVFVRVFPARRRRAPERRHPRDSFAERRAKERWYVHDKKNPFTHPSFVSRVTIGPADGGRDARLVYV